MSTDNEDPREEFWPNPPIKRPIREDPDVEKARLYEHQRAAFLEAYYAFFPLERTPREREPQ